MIEVKNLVKRYGTHTAVDDLSFTVQKGQIYGFLGPNGAGKSTTMNIMTGYLGATEGEVLINGHNILNEPQKAKQCIGYLPELPPLYVDMTVAEYLRFAAELKQITKKEINKEVQKVIDKTKLDEVKHRLIRNLSKGYKQRVGLAQAIMGFPEIIILDEPTVGLDPKQIIEIRQLIRELAQEHTVILSSHILAEVQAVCDYVMIIAKGKLVASDSPDHLEQLMQGAQTVELTAKGSETKVRQIMSGIEQIEEAEYEVLSEEVTSVIVKPKSQMDIREELFYAFAEGKCALIRMNHVHITLEDVFLELTQDEVQQEVEIEQAEQEQEELSDESDI